MRKNKIIRLIGIGLVTISLISCGTNGKNEAKIKEMESELETYKKENNEYKEKLEKLTNEIETIKKNDKKEEINENKEVGSEGKNNKETIVYNKYGNSRFGFSIEYPNFLKKGENPANMDGLEFTNGIATLIASGINNPMCESVDKWYEEELNNITGEIVYKSKGKDFYVISWEKNDIIQYQYRKVGVGSTNGFVIRYPKSEKEKYDEIVNHLYSSFKSGNLKEAH